MVQFLKPAIAIDKQEVIANLIQESLSLKKQSEQLLQTAEQAVEVAIEQGNRRYVD